MKGKQVYTSYNPFFLIPFMLWVVLGGFFLGNYNKQILFSYINSRYSEIRDITMYFVTHMGEGIFIIPILLLIPLLIKKLRTRKYILTALIANVGAFLISQALKSFFNEPRPLTYFKSSDLVHIAEEWEHHYHRSFPSGHTTGAFAFFCFLSLFLTPHHKGWGLFFFAMALSVAYSRIYLAAHFFLDVYVGSIIGTVFSIFAVSVFYKTPYRAMITSS